MEDKLTIRVPQRRFGSGQFTDLTHGNLNLGDRLGACGALQNNLTQFMVGAPIIDYSSIAFTASTGTSDQRIVTLDTSRPSAAATASSFSNASAYSNFTDNLMQNRPASEVSTATGTFTVSFSSGGENAVMSHPTLGNPSVGNFLFADAALSGYVIVADTDTDMYDVNGNFVLTIHLSSSTTVNMSSSVTMTFDVINPTYTEALNWSDMCNTTRSTGAAVVPNTTLLFDTKRNQDLDPTDPMSLYDIQGLSFQGRNIDTQVFPVATLSNSGTVARGGFGAPATYSSSTNTIYTQFGCGRAIGTVDPAGQSDRAVDYFTIFRGPGYVRMLGQVADPATGLPAASEAEKDTSYFFGMFRPYEQVEEYPHPMAFLGDIGWRSDTNVSNRTRPWWRSGYANLSTTDSNIWSADFASIGAGYYTLKAPSILTHDFVMDDPSFNTPAQVKAFPPQSGQTIGNWMTVGSTANAVSNGTEHDAGRIVATEFFGIAQATGWDPVIGWSAPASAVYKYLETPGAPRILPVTLRQHAPDDHSWATLTTHRQVRGTPEGYENIGEVPGMYWMNSIERYDGATAVLYAAGSEFTTGGRTLRMVIGYSQSANAPTGAYSSVPATGTAQTGNLLFDMNEI